MAVDANKARLLELVNKVAPLTDDEIKEALGKIRVLTNGKKET